MIVLSIEASSKPSSVAIAKDGRLLGESFVDYSQMHSQTLLCQLESLTALMGIGLGDIDLIACGTGPGSFTGTRIAASIAKGLAHSLGIGIMPVSSLFAIAFSNRMFSGQALCLSDAQAENVYSALFLLSCGAVERQTKDEKLDINAALDLLSPGQAALVAGDGASRHMELISKTPDVQVVAAPQELFFPRASAIALACSSGRQEAGSGILDYKAFVPSYVAPLGFKANF
ncbi:MAG: tRNA (adenosine(37)-N6)-threonylcarbamoyltransferase complex dimerization subunit type 1 TsaB [Eubacteriaceae bacterium]|nr:tRNA (adenosine(37)-N6)-threonylcarbamoyltransferase complex dimerization subunit type 1 TsaB [Eubacteriaceae bacterium]